MQTERMPIFPLQSLYSVFLRFRLWELKIWPRHHVIWCAPAGPQEKSRRSMTPAQMNHAITQDVTVVTQFRPTCQIWSNFSVINPILISRKILDLQSSDWLIVLPPSFPPSISSRLIVFMCLKCFYLPWNILKLLIQQAFCWETARQVQTANHWVKSNPLGA